MTEYDKIIEFYTGYLEAFIDTVMSMDFQDIPSPLEKHLRRIVEDIVTETRKFTKEVAVG